MKNIITQAKGAKEASRKLRLVSTAQKNEFLQNLADLLNKNTSLILKENQKDLKEGERITPVMRRRLELSKESILGIAQGVQVLIKLPDPVGQVVNSWTRPNGLRISRVRVPIGVIACIFESRPNVIIDVASLCVKSGNAVIVRGGKEAIRSNNVLMSLIQEAVKRADLPAASVQQLEDRRHEAVGELVQLEEYLDLVIPRGREELIRAVSEKARVTVMKHMRGLCHAYVDSEADLSKAIRIVVNAKTSNPATCNTIETVLVHRKIADKFIPGLLQQLFEKGVEVRGCSHTCTYSEKCIPATKKDWDTEYLDLILSVRIVDSYNEAVEHIQKYSSGLTDSIITENKERAKHFMQCIDSAAVLVNASNRFTDGGEFGLGAEIGISTARIHMRGPMTLEDLTVTKYTIEGNGQIRE
jgi:glutamate-5-semialdehyde dehydrogenase